MEQVQFLESSFFKISWIKEPDTGFIGMKTFNKDRVFQIIDLNLPFMEVLFTDIRMLSFMAECFQIRFLDPDEDKIVFNFTYQDKTHYFVISNCKYMSWIPVAAVHCINFLMQNNMVPSTFSKKSITQMCIDLEDNVVIYFDDDFFEKDSKEDSKTQKPEVKIPLFINKKDDTLLN